MKHLPWLLLTLPTITVLLLWNHLPDRLPLHSSGNGPDRFGTRSDFAGAVLSVTAVFGLISYAAIQGLSSFQPVSEREMRRAYWAAAGGSALIGFAVLIVGVLSASR